MPQISKICVVYHHIIGVWRAVTPVTMWHLGMRSGHLRARTRRASEMSNSFHGIIAVGVDT